MGTTYRFDYQVTGAATGTTSSQGQVTRVTTFETYSNATEQSATTTATYTAPPELAQAGTTTTDIKSYFQRNDLEFLQFGALSAGVYMGQNVSTKIVNSPAEVDKRFTLNAGGSFVSTVTYTVTTTIQNSPVPIPPQSSTTTSTVTYLGQETVTVPAGTFTACKFQEVFTTAPNSPTFQWISVGSGVPVKYSELDAETLTITSYELLNTSRVNGAVISN